MRKLLLTITAMLCASSSFADDRTESELKSIASEKLHDIGTSAKARDRGNFVSEEIKVFCSDDNIAIMGYEEGGFVILSKDNGNMPVLGYSDGNYSKALENPALKWWIDCATETLAKKKVKQYLPTDFASVADNVVPFIETHWNQGTPYNNMTPSYESNGKEMHYPTGCVATAMAQAMNYYKYPASATGTAKYSFNPKPGYTESVVLDLSSLSYNWDDMLNNYSSGNYTDEQANSIAALMKICGASIQMAYTADGSGAYTYKAAAALVSNFGYDQNTTYYYRNFYTEKEWNKVAYEALSNKLPVIAAGGGAAGGHCFILDGYDEDGLVHINWGWGPMGGDGFFSLNTFDKFNEGQELLPLAVTIPNSQFKSQWGAYHTSLNIKKLTDTNINVKSDTLLNISYKQYSGSLFLVAQNTDGEVFKIAEQALTGTYWIMDKMVNFSKPNVTIKNKVKDGTYRLYIASKCDQDTEYQPVRCTDGYTQSYTMVVEDGKITSLEPDTDPWWMISSTGIKDITVDNQPNSNSEAVSISGQRVSENFRGIVIENGRKFLRK